MLNEQYKREMWNCREEDEKFRRNFILGDWKGFEALDTKRVQALAESTNTAEFVRIEETMRMAWEILQLRDRIATQERVLAIVAKAEETRRAL